MWFEESFKKPNQTQNTVYLRIKLTHQVISTTSNSYRLLNLSANIF